MTFLQSKKKHSIEVFTVGGPRSGTSLTASLINKMGYSLGPKRWLKKADINNPNGYYECEPLMNISMKLLKRFGGDFHENLPELPPDWLSEVRKERKKIERLVNKGRISLYKDNFLLLFADLYDDLYPDAKWVYIERNDKETHRSRFGDYIDFKTWKSITGQRRDLWLKTRPSQKALHLSYAEYEEDFTATVDKIIDHLGISISSDKRKDVLSIWSPQPNNHKEAEQ